MARSRLEKIGTIFDRVNGLLKTGALKPEDKPIWHDLYAAFPPKLEPRYDRPTPNIEIKPILYKEDVIRARFQKNYKSGTVNLMTTSANYTTPTQRFISIYNQLVEENPNQSEDHLYENALNVFSSTEQQRYEKQTSVPESKSEKVNLDTPPEKKINVEEIFKE